MTHNDQLPGKSEASILKHKKTITAVSVVFALIFIGAMGYEIFSPYGIKRGLSDPIQRLKLLPWALAGDTEAQKQIARTYYAQLLPHSDTDMKRFYWHMKAAEEGDMYAAYLIARAFEHGYGIEVNKRSALKWYRVAADRGDLWSQKILNLRESFEDQDNLLIARTEIKNRNARDVDLSISKRGVRFKDCPECPEMILIPQPDGGKPIGMSKFEVTVANYAACVRENACWYGRANRSFPYPKDESISKLPIVDLNLGEIRDYLSWLYRKTGKNYRLPTRSEWVWAAQGGTNTNYPWGDDPEQICQYGNWIQAPSDQNSSATFPSCETGFTGLAKVGSYDPNDYGLYDMIGNAGEPVIPCGSLRCEPNGTLGGSLLIAKANHNETY